MKSRKLILIFSIALTMVSALFYSCQKEQIIDTLFDKGSNSVSTPQSLVIVGYPNPLNPYDYIGSRHNNIVKQLQQQYANLSPDNMETSIISNTFDVIKKNYPTNESSIDLKKTLNNISGFEGNWRDIDIAKNYRDVIYASSANENVKETFSNFISEISNAASEMISKYGVYTKVTPTLRSPFKPMFMNAYIQIENKYIGSINSSVYTTQEKAMLFSAMAVFRYSIDMNTDGLTPIPDPGPNPEPEALKKWLIGLADAVGAVIGGAAAGGATFGWGTALGALEGASAASTIASLF
jgi:hypothetical protein